MLFPVPMDPSTRNAYASSRRIVLACMILLPLSVFLFALSIGYTFFTASIESSTRAALEQVVVDQRRMIDSFLAQRKANLEFVSAEPGVPAAG